MPQTIRRMQKSSLGNTVVKKTPGVNFINAHHLWYDPVHREVFLTKLKTLLHWALVTEEKKFSYNSMIWITKCLWFNKILWVNFVNSPIFCKINPCWTVLRLRTSNIKFMVWYKNSSKLFPTWHTYFIIILNSIC